MDELTGTSYRKCRAQNRLSTIALARVYNAAKCCTRTAHCTKVVTEENEIICILLYRYNIRMDKPP